MSNYSKQKGNNLEREVSKELSDVFNLSFIRVPNSGAFTGKSNKFRSNQLSKEQNLIMSGDIIVPIELSKFSLECKFYKNFSFTSLFTNNETLNDWISQASNDLDKIWFIILKVNNVGKFLVFDIKHENLFLKSETRLIYKDKYIFTKYDNFFKANKELILKIGNG